MPEVLGARPAGTQNSAFIAKLQPWLLQDIQSVSTLKVLRNHAQQIDIYSLTYLLPMVVTVDYSTIDERIKSHRRQLVL